MKAIILAANKSERLYPFTETRAKPMIRVAGQYILETTIGFLRDAGIHEIIMVVNHQQQGIQEYFGSGNSFGVQIQYITQTEVNGIGNALKLCQPSLKKQNEFMLIYGDLLTDGNIFRKALISRMTTKSDLAVVALPQTSAEYGNVYLDHNMKIHKLIEKPRDTTRSNYVFSGVFILTSRVFDLLDQYENNIEQCYQHIIQKEGLDAVLWEEGWIDIIYPWNILEANKMMMDVWTETRIDSSAVIKGSANIEGPVIIEKDVVIEAGAIIKGPCFIGKNTYIGNHVLIRSYSALGPNSVVGYGCELKNCVVFGESEIGRLSFIGDSVIGQNVHLGAGTTTVNHLYKGEPLPCELPSGTVNSHLDKLGAFVGDDVIIGARHSLAPGTLVKHGEAISDNISFRSTHL